MSELNIPENWVETTLGIVSEKISYGGTAKAGSSGEFKFLRITDLTESGVNWETVPFCKLKGGEKYIVKNGDIVIARTGGTVGKSYRIGNPPGNAIFASYLIKVSPSDLIRSSKFLSIYLKSPFYWSQIQEKAQGAAQPNVNATKLSEIPIALPSFEEQERIVQKIESCFEKIDAIEQNLIKAETLLEMYRESLLAKAFHGELTPQNKSDETASALLERVRLEREKSVPSKKKKVQLFAPITDVEKPFDIPESWEWVRLGDIGNNIPYPVVDGPFGSSINTKRDYIDKGIPVIRMTNIKPHLFKSDKLKFITKEKYEALKRHNILPGDVLMSKVGTIGESCIFPREIPCALISTTGVTRFRVGEIVFGKYLCFYINFIRPQLKKIASTSIQPFLNMKTVKAQLIPLPGLSEQERIIKNLEARLENLDKIYEKVHALKLLAQKTRASILTNAFQGCLVEQVESEGTGQELLEKILESKITEKPVRKAKKKTKKKVVKSVVKKKKTKKK